MEQGLSFMFYRNKLQRPKTHHLETVISHKTEGVGSTLMQGKSANPKIYKNLCVLFVHTHKKEYLKRK